MKRLVCSVCLLLFPVLLSAKYSPSFFADVLWSKGIVRAEAHDSIKKDVALLPSRHKNINKLRMESYRRSSELSYELLTQQVLLLPIESGTSLVELIEGSDYSRQKLSYLIKNNIRLKQYPIGYYETVSQAHLTFRDIISILPYSYPNEALPKLAKPAHSTRYTSLIIDTRGSGFSPLVLPSILDEGGLEIYGRRFVDIDHATESGIVSYCFDEEEAVNHKRAGEYPYFTIALKTLHGNPVISYADTQKLFSNSENIQHLKECKVIMIIERTK